MALVDVLKRGDWFQSFEVTFKPQPRLRVSRDYQGLVKAIQGDVLDARLTAITPEPRTETKLTLGANLEVDLFFSRHYASPDWTRQRSSEVYVSRSTKAISLSIQIHEYDSDFFEVLMASVQSDEATTLTLRIDNEWKSDNTALIDSYDARVSLASKPKEIMATEPRGLLRRLLG